MHFSTLFAAALVGAPLIAAHGKIAVVEGDQGGNGTALGIMGAVIPGEGRNKVTEPDTTVFKGSQANGCGRTTGGGNNQIESGTAQVMRLSGPTLPQVSAGGYLQGTLHIVTSDGAGPYTAYLNTDGTGQSWSKIDMVQQVPGSPRGNIRKTQKRATNINEDFPFKVAIPAGTTCTGSAAGQQNLCMVKLVNPSNAGPFGGCMPVQQPQPGTPPPAAALGAPAVAPAEAAPAAAGEAMQ